MTRTIYMEVRCNDCGYQGEMDGRKWSPNANRCPKCQLGTLERGETVQKRGTTLEAAMADTPLETARHRQAEPVAEVVAELPKELPGVPVAKRYYGSGREAVECYVEEGKSLDEIIELMKGKLQATTVKVYYFYAIKDPKLAPAKQKVEPPESVKAAATLPVKQYKDMRIINIDVLEGFLNGLKRDLELAPKTESTSGALIVVFQILGMVKTFKRDIYLK